MDWGFPCGLQMSNLSVQTKTVAKSGKGYFPHLDALRGIAIIMVVVFHAFSFYPETPDQTNLNRFLAVLSQGVPLFFILSGFLISLIVFDDSKPFAWRTYTMRRFAKIFPPFALSLIFFSIRDLRHSQFWDISTLVAANLVTLPNLLPRFNAINPVSWSLFVELHFYLVFPLVYLGLKKVTPRFGEILTIGVFVFVPLLCRWAAWNSPVESIGERFFLISRFPCAMDYFAWGMVFCYLQRNHRDKIGRELLANRVASFGLVLLPCFVLLFTFILRGYNLSSTQDLAGVSELCRFLIGLIAFLLLFFSNVAAPTVLIDNRPLRYVGLISYEWFLFHAGIIPWLRYQIGHVLHYSFSPTDSAISFFILTLVSMLASLGISAAIYHWFSQPAMKLFRKY